MTFIINLIREVDLGSDLYTAWWLENVGAQILVTVFCARVGEHAQKMIAALRVAVVGD